MKFTIRQASMTYSKEDGYVGRVEFEVEAHKAAYEVTLHSKRGTEWSYNLLFSDEPGDEDQIFAVEEQLEEDDDNFDLLVQAAVESLPTAPTKA